MKQQKYVAWKRGEVQKANDWFEQCKKDKIPYIAVQTRIKYADIRYENDSSPYETDEQLNKNDEIIKEETGKLFHKYAAKNSDCKTASTYAFIHNIPIENASKLAEELFDLIVSFTNKRV